MDLWRVNLQRATVLIERYSRQHSIEFKSLANIAMKYAVRGEMGDVLLQKIFNQRPHKKVLMTFVGSDHVRERLDSLPIHS